MNKEVEKSLSIIGIKPHAQKVLYFLLENNDSPASIVSSSLGLPKSTVYDALDELLQNGLVVEFSGEKGKIFSVVDNERLKEVYDQKIKDLQKSQSSLLSFITDHPRTSSSTQPRIKFYSGISGMKQAFRDTSWRKDIKVAYLMWPMKDMIDTLGEEFLEHHGRPRYNLGVKIKSIRKESDKILNTKGHEWLKSDPNEHLREVKYAPKSFDWKMSYWIYGDQCLFAGGDKEPFAFVVKSKEFASMMTLMWEQVWNVCKE